MIYSVHTLKFRRAFHLLWWPHINHMLGQHQLLCRLVALQTVFIFNNIQVASVLRSSEIQQLNNLQPLQSSTCLSACVLPQPQFGVLLPKCGIIFLTLLLTLLIPHTNNNHIVAQGRNGRRWLRLGSVLLGVSSIEVFHPSHSCYSCLLVVVTAITLEFEVIVISLVVLHIGVGHSPTPICKTTPGRDITII